jgi:hypothetical protein
MQSSNEEKKQPASGQGSQPDAELNETWRALLGLPPSGQPEEAPADDPAGPVQPLAGDPWSHLIHAQGMQSVDLQKIKLHELYPEASDEDVEHALNLMREATGQLRALDDPEQKK